MDMLTRHDTYCRCRSCKPSLVGSTYRNQNRLVAALILAVIVGAIMELLS